MSPWHDLRAWLGVKSRWSIYRVNLPCCVSCRPDMTFALDWAWKADDIIYRVMLRVISYHVMSRHSPTTAVAKRTPAVKAGGGGGQPEGAGGGGGGGWVPPKLRLEPQPLDSEPSALTTQCHVTSYPGTNTNRVKGTNLPNTSFVQFERDSVMGRKLLHCSNIDESKVSMILKRLCKLEHCSLIKLMLPRSCDCIVGQKHSLVLLSFFNR